MAANPNITNDYTHNNLVALYEKFVALKRQSATK